MEKNMTDNIHVNLQRDKSHKNSYLDFVKPSDAHSNLLELKERNAYLNQEVVS